MAIIIVAGPCCSGKSTFIKNNFPDREVVDLYDFQKKYMSISEVWGSYVKCKEVLIDKIKEGKQVVLEHTLLKEIRRKYYIDAIREITDQPIDIYFLTPKQEIYKERLKKRNQSSTNDFINNIYSVLEIPTKEEGFRNITIISDS